MATPNQQSYWFSGQTVTATQMNAFSQDLYARITDITETPGNISQGCILNIGSIVQTGGNVAVAAGSFRFPDAVYAFLPYNTGIFGNADAATVAVTGNGFIVARYVVNPTSMSNTNYTFATSYIFVTSVNTTTDCIICVVTSGTISGPGTYFINTAASNAQAIAQTATNVALTPANVPSFIGSYFPDITDVTGLVSITGASGLAVTNNISAATGTIATKRIMTSGLVQGGVTTTNGTSTPITVTMTSPMPTSSFSVVGTHNGLGVATAISISVDIVNSQQFRINANDASLTYVAATIQWIAVWII